MKLTLSERFTVIGLLPVKGNIMTMRRTGEARDVLVPTEQEKAEFKITELPDGRLGWPAESNKIEQDIPIGETVTDVVRAALDKLNRESELGPQHVTLYEKFVEAAEIAAGKETPTDEDHDSA